MSKRLRSMRTELSRYIIGLALVASIIFTSGMIEYFESGLNKASYASILMDVRTYDQRYRVNPDTPLPNSYSTQMYLDNWEGASEFYQKAVPFAELEPNTFREIEWKPNGHHEWDNAHFLITYLHILPDNRKLYVVLDFDVGLFTQEERDDFDRHFHRVFFFSCAYFVITLLIVFFYNRRINRHTQSLAKWAEEITPQNMDQPHPNFRYAELEQIASQLQGSYQRNAVLLEREHQFLRHASHELRTPIAVTRTNLELIEKMGMPPGYERPVERIDRANKGMQQLTETLLWLSRENQAAPSVHEIALDQLLHELIDDLRYLLNEKEVALKTEHIQALSPCLVSITPMRIILSNLIRNAFQYTCEGEIRFDLNEERLIIENIDAGSEMVDPDNSFGLGLMLVKKICEKLGWELDLAFSQQGVKACLILKNT